MKPVPRLSAINKFAFETRRALSTLSRSFLNISDEVQEAVLSKRPVVALESAIYTHALALRLETLVRSHGGIPATIGIVKGTPTIGFSSEALIEYLERVNLTPAMKVSRRDIAVSCAKNFDGGTTVAGTSVLAHLAGIEVFATGGLGGVHRDNPSDISADLHELAQTPITVVSSGCKSFLDIPKTLEYLETMGVIVATFSDGRGTNPDRVTFPAFWTRETAIPSPMVLVDEVEAARVIHFQRHMANLEKGLKSGILFANPISERHSLPASYMDEIMNTAIKDASANGASGHANTPFVLRRIRELTHDKTIVANEELVTANVIRGTRTAVELASQSCLSDVNSAQEKSPLQSEKPSSPNSKDGSTVLVLGSLAIDDHCDCEMRHSTDALDPTLYTSNLGTIYSSTGGVGFNLSVAVSYMGVKTEFCTIVGNDPAGVLALNELKRLGLSTDDVVIEPFPARTARYVAINKPDASLFVAVADMKIFENVSPEFLNRVISKILSSKPRIVIVDGNFDGSIEPILRTAQSIQARIIFEPVSVPKSTRVFEHSLRLKQKIDVVTPNNHELAAMFAYHKSRHNVQIRTMDDSQQTVLPETIRIALSQDLVSREELQQAVALSACFDQVIVKLGSRGILAVDNASQDTANGSEHVRATQWTPELGRQYHSLRVRHIQPPFVLKGSQITSVNGAGDTFVGVYAAGLFRSFEPLRAAEIAARAALMTLQCRESVSDRVKDLSSILV